MTQFSSERIVVGELGINNCGIQSIQNGSALVVRRRIDYTLMYIASGTAQIRQNGKMCEVHAGEALFFCRRRSSNTAFPKARPS